MPLKLDWRGQQVEREWREGTADIMNRSLFGMQARARSNPKTRRDTGAHVNSIGVNLATADNLVGEFGAGMDYSYWIEVGTSRMEARPTLTEAFDQGVVEFRSAMRQAGVEMRG